MGFIKRAGQKLCGLPLKQKILGGAAVILLILIALVFVKMQKKEKEETRIKRNSYGQGVREESLEAEVSGEDSQEIDVKVRPREYTGEELQSLFRQAMKEIDQMILGENQSLDAVSLDLDLPDRISGFPFAVTWELSRYDVMDMTGRIQKDMLKELDKSGEGILIKLTAVLRYGEEEALYSTEARIVTDHTTPTRKEQLEELIREADESTKETPYLELPQKIDGRKIRWKKAGMSGFPALFLLAAAGAVCLFMLDKQKKEQAKKQRMTQMLCDYPEIISQFTMLMGAGMTAKNTWKKVTEDYRQKKAETARTRDAYEEIVYTWQEMQSGIPEAEAYERFARRCGLTPYMKFGALLSQNLKKGAKGLSDILNVEALQAMEDRKSRAKRLGEEAGTKLLAPMFLMLAVVMAVIIIPAFWSIQI